MNFQVSINDEPYFAVIGDNLTKVEEMVINDYLDDMPDLTRLYIKHDDRIVTYIRKDKTKKHHTHNGYMFSA